MTNLFISNESNKLWSLAVLALALGSSLAVGVTTGNRAESKFKSFDPDTGDVGPMTEKFTDGRFEISVETVNVGDEVQLFSLEYRPSKKLLLVYTESGTEVMIGDYMYIYDPSLGIPEFNESLKVALYATKDAAKVGEFNSAGTQMRKKMEKLTQMIAADKGFSKYNQFFSFGKLKMKQWNYKISMKQLIAMNNDNEELMAAIGDEKNAFNIKPEGENVGFLIETLKSSTMEEIQKVVDLTDEVYNSKTETQIRGTDAIKGMMASFAGKVLKAIEQDGEYWGKFDSYKEEIQAQYLLPVYTGGENLVMAALKGNKPYNLNVSADDVGLLNSAANHRVIADRENLEKFHMLAGFNQLKDEQLNALYKMMDSNATRNEGEEVTGLTALKLRIAAPYNGIITKMKFQLASIAFNQLGPLKKSMSVYIQALQAKYENMAIFDENKPLNVSLGDFEVAYWMKDFANPQNYVFPPTPPPFLVQGRRRNLIIL